MKIRIPRRWAGLCLLFVIASAWATEPGSMMKMSTTVHMQMAGLPAMPTTTHTSEVCSPAKLPDPEQWMQHRKDCAVSNVRHSGGTVSYHMQCSGAMSMSGDGKFHMSANGDVHGSFHMVGLERGHSITLDSQIEGERVGACDYTPPAMRG